MFKIREKSFDLFSTRTVNISKRPFHSTAKQLKLYLVHFMIGPDRCKMTSGNHE